MTVAFTTKQLLDSAIHRTLLEWWLRVINALIRITEAPRRFKSTLLNGVQ